MSDIEEMDGNCANCGRPKGEHKHSRAAVTCPGGRGQWRPVGMMDPIEALKTAPDPEVAKLREQNEEMGKELLNVQERLAVFLYVLMHDSLPAGAMSQQITQILENVDKDFVFAIPELETLARRQAKILLGSKLAVMPKHMREFLESFPERIRSSPHFDAIMAEEEGRLVVNDRTRQAVIAEVVRRQQQDPDRA